MGEYEIDDEEESYDEGENILGAIVGIAFAVGLGLLGAAIIGGLAKPKCPACGNSVIRNAPYCENCNTVLRW